MCTRLGTKDPSLLTLLPGISNPDMRIHFAAGTFETRALAPFLPPSSPSVGRQETCSLSHASYHRRLDKRSACSDLHHHNFFCTRGMCDEQNTTWSKSRLGYQNFMAFNCVMRFSEKGMRVSILAMTRSMSYWRQLPLFSCHRCEPSELRTDR